MIILETKYLMYIHEIKKKNIFSWIFRSMYKKKLKKRLDILNQQYKSGLVEKEAYEIWFKMIKNVL